MITLRRVYDHINSNNEATILVDRLWPRGISKEKTKIDLWLKEIAPSDKLRKWFSHDVKKWEKFKDKYKEEIAKDNKKLELLKQIKQIEKERGNVVLLYSAKDREHNNAMVLKELLANQ